MLHPECMFVYILYTQHNIYMYNTCIYTCDFAKASTPIKYTKKINKYDIQH